MVKGAAMLRIDWLDGRSLEDWHSDWNCFVGDSHRLLEQALFNTGIQVIKTSRTCYVYVFKWVDL
jgi:hypothetical protein